MKKEILLISANTYKVPYPVYPIGILYLQTFLNRNLPEFEVSNFDCNIDSIDSLGTVLSGGRFSYVGISLRNVDDVNFYSKDSFAHWYKKIVDVVRNSCDAVIIVGGSCFSIFPKEFFDFLSPDFGVKGEGEFALFQLIKGLENDLPVDMIEGLVSRKDQKTVINPRKSYIRNLELNFDNRLIDYYWGKQRNAQHTDKKRLPV
jgi:radical SAM superfamily enzyme YgiQ (UPF0313 family)